MTFDRMKPRAAVHGHAHAQARKQWAARHQPTDPCVRCGHTLGPMGPHLHLDHHDTQKSIYLGFSHGNKPCPVCRRRCNLSAAGKLGNAVQKGQRTVRAYKPTAYSNPHL